MSLAGTMMRRKKEPMLQREDSSIKKAMKNVMKLGRKNMPRMSQVQRR
jgi:hypothetical protein